MNDGKPVKLGNSDTTLEWAMKLGQIEEEEQEGHSKKVVLVRDDNDVYPLSIHYSGVAKFRMRVIRIVVFVLCHAFLIPYDLYIPAHFRISFFGTDAYYERVPFNTSDPKANYTFDLSNCRVALKLDSTNSSSFYLEFGF